MSQSKPTQTPPVRRALARICQCCGDVLLYPDQIRTEGWRRLPPNDPSATSDRPSNDGPADAWRCRSCQLSRQGAA